MPRPLEIATLDRAARDYAGFFLEPNRKSVSGDRWISGSERIKQDFVAFTYKDEFDYLVQMIRKELGSAALRFDDLMTQHFTPRDDRVFERLLADKLAITSTGEHIEGKIGTTQLGTRIVGQYTKIIKTRRGDIPLVKNAYWPIYAGEGHERVAGSGVADPLPEGAEPLGVGAAVTNLSAEAAILAVDAMADASDEGSAAANIRIRTGSQPVDPDATETGTLLVTLVCSDPAFSAGVDDADGSVSAALDTVTPANASATGTAGYGRMAAAGAGADDHIDGNCGVIDEAFLFDTVSIVSGSLVNISSGSLGLSQGSTAT